MPLWHFERGIVNASIGLPTSDWSAFMTGKNLTEDTAETTATQRSPMVFGHAGDIPEHWPESRIRLSGSAWSETKQRACESSNPARRPLSCDDGLLSDRREITHTGAGISTKQWTENPVEDPTAAISEGDEAYPVQFNPDSRDATTVVISQKTQKIASMNREAPP
ncbi:MAG: hypothetical protein ACI9JM_000851 [Halioglobus sp.]|jgi:hypothetical protein